MLELRNLSKTFNPGTVHEKKALCGVNLKLEKGDFAAIVGSNGAGKSTLFNAIAGDFFPDEGSIMLGGEDLTYLPAYRRSRNIGRLFQDPMRGTAPHMTIEENLALAYLRTAKHQRAFFSRVSKADKAFFRDQLARLDMGLEDRMGQSVGLLSGGQRQALTLLMSTMVPPKLLLLDEHTAALDPGTAEKVLRLTRGRGGPYLPDDHPQHEKCPGTGQPHTDDGFRPHRAGPEGGGAPGHDGGGPAPAVPRRGWKGTGQRPDLALRSVKDGTRMPPACIRVPFFGNKLDCLFVSEGIQ